MYDENHGEMFETLCNKFFQIIRNLRQIFNFNFNKDNIWIKNSDQTSFAGIISIALKHISGEKLGSTLY